MSTTTAPAATTATAPETAGRTAGRLARRGLVRRALTVALVALGILMTTALPSSAATGYLHNGALSINSYYGAVSGNVYIPYQTQHYVSLSAYYRDAREDGVCSVTQVRGVYTTGNVTGWVRLGNSCVTTQWSYNTRTVNAPTGTAFANAQTRVCQSDRYGTIIGSCSAPVVPQSWSWYSYTY